MRTFWKSYTQPPKQDMDQKKQLLSWLVMTNAGMRIIALMLYHWFYLWKLLFYSEIVDNTMI